MTIWIPPSYTPSEKQVPGWNSIDNALDQLNQGEGVTLVLKLLRWVVEYKFEDSIGEHFLLMWKSGRVVLEVPPDNWCGE